jgi:hypothetical protein
MLIVIIWRNFVKYTEANVVSGSREVVSKDRARASLDSVSVAVTGINSNL